MAKNKRVLAVHVYTSEGDGYFVTNALKAASAFKSEFVDDELDSMFKLADIFEHHLDDPDQAWAGGLAGGAAHGELLFVPTDAGIGNGQISPGQDMTVGKRGRYLVAVESATESAT